MTSTLHRRRTLAHEALRQLELDVANLRVRILDHLAREARRAANAAQKSAVYALAHRKAAEVRR